MTVIASSMVAPDGTLLQDLAIPGGWSWAKVFAPSGDMVINSNRLNTNASPGDANVYAPNIIPSSADYIVRADLDMTLAGPAQEFDLISRWQIAGDGSRYWLGHSTTFSTIMRYTPADGVTELQRWTTGGASYTSIELRVAGDFLAIYTNRTIGRIGVVDANPIVGIGVSGLLMSSVQSVTAWPQLTNFELEAAAFDPAPSSGIPRAIAAILAGY